MTIQWPTNTAGMNYTQTDELSMDRRRKWDNIEDERWEVEREREKWRRKGESGRKTSGESWNGRWRERERERERDGRRERERETECQKIPLLTTLNAKDIIKQSLVGGRWTKRCHKITTSLKIISSQFLVVAALSTDPSTQAKRLRWPDTNHIIAEKFDKKKKKDRVFPEILTETLHQPKKGNFSCTSNPCWSKLFAINCICCWYAHSNSFIFSHLNILTIVLVFQWGLFIKMATACESQRWGTLADLRPGQGHGDQWIDCVGGMSAESSSCPTNIFHCRSLCQWSLNVDTKYAALFLWGAWLEKQARNRQKQAEATEGYLSSELGKLSMSIEIIDLDCGSGHCSFEHHEQRELFLVLSAVLHFTSFPFSFFSFSLLYSSIAQTL